MDKLIGQYNKKILIENNKIENLKREIEQENQQEQARLRELQNSYDLKIA